MMDLDGFKGLLGLLDEDTAYDTQIDTAISICEKYEDLETYPEGEDLQRVCVLCELERASPELTSTISSYSVGKVSESFKLGDSSKSADSYCSLYALMVDELVGGTESFGAGHFNRGGQSAE